jgi:CheY-like chemotaxis protein
LAGLRLLVVDDNAINQQVAQELLSNEGAHVEIADGGDAAVRQTLSAAPPFDAVLMDVQMPGMDGYQATRALRRYDGMQTLPIIAMTANAMETDKAACAAAGMDDHVAKPIDLDAAIATILKHCAHLTNDAAQTVMSTTAEPSRQKVDVDFDAALRRMDDRKALFATVARRFLTESVTITTELRHRLDGGAQAEAAMLLHTLKGLAGTMGMTSLAELAMQLEVEFKVIGRLTDQATDMAALETALASGNEALAALLAGSDFASPSPTAEESTMSGAASRGGMRGVG